MRSRPLFLLPGCSVPRAVWLLLLALAALAICPPGRYIGANRCNDCPAGQMQHMSGRVSCEICPPDTRSDRGATRCLPCARGKFTLDIAVRSTCSYCSAGRHAVSFEAGVKCVACAPGTYAENVTPRFRLRPHERTPVAACAEIRRKDSLCASLAPNACARSARLTARWGGEWRAIARLL